MKMSFDKASFDALRIESWLKVAPEKDSDLSKIADDALNALFSAGQSLVVSLAKAPCTKQAPNVNWAAFYTDIEKASFPQLRSAARDLLTEFNDEFEADEATFAAFQGLDYTAKFEDLKAKDPEPAATSKYVLLTELATSKGRIKAADADKYEKLAELFGFQSHTPTEIRKEARKHLAAQQAKSAKAKPAKAPKPAKSAKAKPAKEPKPAKSAKAKPAKEPKPAKAPKPKMTKALKAALVVGSIDWTGEHDPALRQLNKALGLEIENKDSNDLTDDLAKHLKGQGDATSLAIAAAIASNFISSQAAALTSLACDAIGAKDDLANVLDWLPSHDIGDLAKFAPTESNQYQRSMTSAEARQELVDLSIEEMAIRRELEPVEAKAKKLKKKLKQNLSDQLKLKKAQAQVFPLFPEN